jgi:hypothetical protein
MFVSSSDTQQEQRMESKIDNHLTESDVALRLGVPVRTLQQWRFQKRVLPYVKLGKLVRYSEKDISTYARRQTVSVSD